jgi:cysteine desulfurase/selenocysteine lyase
LKAEKVLRQAGLACCHVRQEGLVRIRRHKTALLDQLLRGPRSMPGIHIYGPASAEHHGGAVSFNLEGRNPAEAGFLLDESHGL